MFASGGIPDICDRTGDALGVQTRGLVVRSPVSRRTFYGGRSSRLSPHDAASSSRAPSVGSADPRLGRPLRAEPQDSGQVAGPAPPPPPPPWGPPGPGPPPPPSPRGGRPLV